MIEGVISYITQNPVEITAIASSALAVVATGLKSFLRRPRKTSQGAEFFTKADLLQTPIPRPAYSDRTAYIMAEMSALAYFKFEEAEGAAVLQAIEKFKQLIDDDKVPFAEGASQLLAEFRDDLLINNINSQDILAKILENSGFKLLDTINIGGTQGFVCKQVDPNRAEFRVVAFRGTEKALEDWLTDADAVPASGLNEGIKVHNGFWQALTKKPNENQECVFDCVSAILKKDGFQTDHLPCYFTGHSLGGALALITTVHIAKDVSGACYTFGAPRVANYNFFENMKTPVYRIVNSSDIVPRVPPGAGMGLVLKLVQASNWLTQFIPGVSKFLDWVEQKVDQLNGYRHHGDLRYLTDIKAGNYSEVKLLQNPPAIDRIWWMWQHVRKSFMEPVKSHGMAIYRKKLQHIAIQRNTNI